MNTHSNIDENLIRANLKTQFIGKPLYVFNCVSSTFDKIAEFERTHGLTIVAISQTSGRGRLGRNWSSDGGGIYMSFNLVPDMSPKDATELTIPCAVGVAEALREYGNCHIKWPNDIVMNGKKICGILSTMGVNNGALEYVCVGIGVNTNKEKFDDLPHASSIKLITNRECDENKIICSILENIEQQLNLDKETVLNRFKELCITIGKTVSVHYTDERPDFVGECTDITEDGSLVVKKDNKTITVSSGEVSVRGLYGYI